MPGKIMLTNADGKKLSLAVDKKLILQKVDKSLEVTTSGKQGPPGPPGSFEEGIVDGGYFTE